ncbi:MAG TPA: hypothetical protein VIJ72_04120 [Rhizomicrobium sp.]
MLRPLAVFAAALLLLGGCGIFESRADLAQQKTPNYKAGYSDGCASANAQGTDMRRGDQIRDDTLFASDKAYRAGWHTGFAACRSSQSPAPTSLPDIKPGGQSNLGY